MCMMEAVSTTVCACQASTDVAVSAKLDLVSRQGECWALGKLHGCGIEERGRMMGVPQDKNPTVRAHLGQIFFFFFFLTPELFSSPQMIFWLGRGGTLDSLYFLTKADTQP